MVPKAFCPLCTFLCLSSCIEMRGWTYFGRTWTRFSPEPSHHFPGFHHLDLHRDKALHVFLTFSNLIGETHQFLSLNFCLLTKLNIFNASFLCFSCKSIILWIHCVLFLKLFWEDSYYIKDSSYLSYMLQIFPICWFTLNTFWTPLIHEYLWFEVWNKSMNTFFVYSDFGILLRKAKPMPGFCLFVLLTFSSSCWKFFHYFIVSLQKRLSLVQLKCTWLISWDKDLNG